MTNIDNLGILIIRCDVICAQMEKRRKEMDTEKSENGEIEGEAKKLAILVISMSAIVFVMFSVIPML